MRHTKAHSSRSLAVQVYASAVASPMVAFPIFVHPSSGLRSAAAIRIVTLPATAPLPRDSVKGYWCGTRS